MLFNISIIVGIQGIKPFFFLLMDVIQNVAKIDLGEFPL